MAQNIANPELDALDLKILTALQKNCRLTLAELSEHVGLSQSPCLRRWRRLEEEGYITGYTALVNARKLGRKMMAFVEIKLAMHSAAGAGMLPDDRPARLLPARAGGRPRRL